MVHSKSEPPIKLTTKMTPKQQSLDGRIADLDAQSHGYWFLMLAFSILSWRWFPSERNRLIARLGLSRGARVLDHCAGTGDNFQAILSCIGSTGELHAFDLSPAMINKARRRSARLGANIRILQADAFDLPYKDNYFDSVIHYGAINQFGERISAAIAEIDRVTRPDGIISIFDEGIDPSKQSRWWARLMIWRNDLFKSMPPLDQLPLGVDPCCEWVMNGRFWEIVFRKSSRHDRLETSRGDVGRRAQHPKTNS